MNLGPPGLLLRTLSISALEAPRAALGRPYPFMRPREVAAIELVLKRLRPSRCLEWGAGFSTLHFPRFIPTDAVWISVEHDEGWFSQLRDRRADGERVRIYLARPDRLPFTGEHSDGTNEELRKYVELPSGLGMEFDFILVDGRARNDCLREGAALLSERGVLVLHDANRGWYRPQELPLPHRLLLTDDRKDEGGLWLGSRRALGGLGRELEAGWRCSVRVERALRRAGPLRFPFPRL